ncbi:MAG: cytochrome C oxidase subunit IV family protein [Acidobacteriota bacterium]
MSDTTTASEQASLSPGALWAWIKGDHHRWAYMKIWLWLFVLTMAEVFIAEQFIIDIIGPTLVNIGLVLMALAKAAYVALIYMHLNSETRVLRWTALWPFAFPALYAFVLIGEAVWRVFHGQLNGMFP